MAESVTPIIILPKLPSLLKREYTLPPTPKHWSWICPPQMQIGLKPADPPDALWVNCWGRFYGGR